MPSQPLRYSGRLMNGAASGALRGAQVLVVPLDLLPGPVGHVAEVVRFGRPTGVLEVRAGRWTEALGGVDPLHPVAGRAGQRRGWRLEVLEPLLGQQLPVAEQHALVADEQVRAAAPLRHPPWRLAVALVPDELERWLGADGRELESHRHGRRSEFLVGRSVGRVGLDRQRGQHAPALPVRLPQVQHRERHVVVVAAEVAHRAIAEVPPAVPPGAGEVRRMERPRRRGAEPQVPVDVRRNRHLFLEPIDDLDAVVEPVRLVELLGGRRVLQSPRAIGPHVDLAHRTDDAGHEDLPDRAPGLRGVALVAHLRRQLRVLRGRLADEAGLPDVVGERLLAVDVLAVRQRQVGGERVRLLAGGDHDGVELLRIVKDAPEVLELPGLRVPHRRAVDRVLIHVADDDDVLVGMRRHRPRRGTPAPAARAVRRRCVGATAPCPDGEFAHVVGGATAGSDERDVQLAVQVLAAQKRGGACHHPGRRHRPADELTPRHLTRARLLRRPAHGSHGCAPRRAVPRRGSIPKNPLGRPRLPGAIAGILVDPSGHGNGDRRCQKGGPD